MNKKQRINIKMEEETKKNELFQNVKDYWNGETEERNL